jgi:ribosome-associated protein
MEQKLLIAQEAVIEKKADDAIIMDLRGISGVTDYFLICSGQNPIQVRAITDNVIKCMQESGYPFPAKEGYQEGRWILLDYGDLIVHVMQPAERDFYALENLWHDAKVLSN